MNSSISEKGICEFFDKECLEKQAGLFLPAVAFFQDSTVNLKHSLLTKTLENTWFSNNIVYPKDENLKQVYLSDQENLPVLQEITKTKSVRIYPTAIQRRILKQWLGTSRFVYNWTLQFLRSCVNFNPSWMEVKKYATKLLPGWTKDTPFQVKAIAIRDAHRSYWSKGRSKFRSRKNPTQTCFIPKSAISTKGVYHSYTGELKFKEELPKNFLDSRLLFQYNQWFMTIPYKSTNHVAENQGHGIVALDPGVRSFITFYSETSAGHLGKADISRISRLCYYLDDLISRTSKTRGNKKQRFKLVQNRIRLKIKNLVKELHHKVALFLVNNFDVILLPTFEVSQMVVKKSRKLQSKSVRPG